MAEPKPASPTTRLRRLSIATVLTATLAGMVALTVIIVLAIVLWTGRETTLNLTRDKQELLLNNMETRLREAVDPASNQLAFIAEVFGQPREVAYGRNRIADLLTGARFNWRGARNYVRLDPAQEPAHVLRLERGGAA